MAGAREFPRHGPGQVGDGGIAMNQLQRLHEAGVSIWLDTLSRELLESSAR